MRVFLWARYKSGLEFQTFGICWVYVQKQCFDWLWGIYEFWPVGLKAYEFQGVKLKRGVTC